MENADAANSPRLQRIGVFAFVVFAFVVFLVFRAALEAPSGDGVPGPADWARHEQTP